MADQDASFVISAKDATKEAFASASQNLQQLGERTNEVKEMMHQLAGALAIHEFAHLIGNAIEARAKLDDLSQIAGTTPEMLSRFEVPAMHAGTSLESVATSMAKLTRSIGEAKAGNTEKEGFLRALGIDPATATDSAKSMETVMRAIEGVSDKNIASYVSTQLLGRGYAELRPLMHEVVEQGELQATATDAQVAKAKELTKEYQSMKFQFDQIFRALAEELLPTLHSIIGAISDTTNESKGLSEQGEVLATMLKMVASLGLAAVDVFYAVGHVIAQTAAAAVAAASGNFREAATIWKEGNEDVLRHTEETNKKIEKLWHDTAAHVKTVKIAPAADADDGAKKILDANLKAMIEFQKHYPELMAKEQGFTMALQAESRLRAELILEAGKRGALNQREVMIQLSENEEKKLNDENNTLQRELALVKQKGDLLKKAEIESAILRNNAAIETNRTLTVARIQSFELMENQAFNQRIAHEVTQIQKENLTEKQSLENSYIERKNTIDQAERLRLIGAEEAARQRELVELKHQAALGNVHAQGVLARRKFDEMDNRQKLQSVFGTLQEITAGVATHNRAMFEINKIAATANAIINTAVGVTNALAAYPPPLSFAMAAAQLLAGLAQIQAIQSASFGGASSPPSVGGGSATPTYQAPSVATNVGNDTAQSPNTVVHFHGTSQSEEATVRRFVDSLNEASRNGAQIRVV